MKSNKKNIILITIIILLIVIVIGYLLYTKVLIKEDNTNKNIDEKTTTTTTATTTNTVKQTNYVLGINYNNSKNKTYIADDLIVNQDASSIKAHKYNDNTNIIDVSLNDSELKDKTCELINKINNDYYILCYKEYGLDFSLYKINNNKTEKTME